MLYVMALAATTSLVIVSVLNYATTISDITKGTREATTEVLALSSVADYLAYGLRKRWCFTDTAIKEKDKDCTLNTGRNSMRLLMSDETLKSLWTVLKVSGASAPDKIRLNFFKFDIQLSSLAELHPLYTILSQVNNAKYPTLRITVERGDWKEENKKKYPVRGKQVIVITTVELVPHNSNDQPISLQDIISIYPRELSAFTLITPRSLYLNTDNAPNLPSGNLGFSTFGRATDVAGPGLIFQGPVFVNHDIRLSEIDSSKPRNEQRFTPVTFAEKVYIGNGAVYRENKKFTPETIGGLEDRFYTSDPTFGGFMKGIEVEGEQDKGLNVMSGDGNNITLPSTTSLDTCNNINLTMSELGRTKGSYLVGKTVNTSSSIRFRMGLTGVKTSQHTDVHWNQFSEQSMKTRYESNHNTDEFQRNPTVTGLKQQDLSTHGTVMEIFVDLDSTTGADQEVHLHLGRETRATIYPEVQRSTQALQDKVDYWQKDAKKEFDKDIKDKEKERDDIIADRYPQIASSQAALAAKNQEIADQNTAIATAQTAYDQAVANGDPQPVIDQAQADLDAATAALATLEAEKATLETNLADAMTQAEGDSAVQAIESQIRAIEDQIADIPNQLKDAKDELAAAIDFNNQLASDPPEIDISVKDFVVGGRPMPNILDLHIQADADDLNRLIPGMEFDLRLKTYDLGVVYEKNVRDWDGVNQHDKSLDDFDHLNKTLRLRVSADGTRIENRDSNFGNFAMWAAKKGTDADNIPLETSSLAQNVADCNEGNVGEGSSIDVIAWGFDMSSSTKLSWGFTDSWPNSQEVEITGVNAGSDPEFLVESIVNECIIFAEAEFVAGFFACNKLVIKSRQKPLRIVGTIIANNIDIHETAYQQGIVWTNIYHPESVKMMQTNGILAGYDGSCKDMSEPVWHPFPNVKELSNFWRCNPVSLRRTADPFTWTTVDPDCGIPPDQDSISTLCKHQPRRMLFKRLSRRYL